MGASDRIVFLDSAGSPRREMRFGSPEAVAWSPKGGVLGVEGEHVTSTGRRRRGIWTVRPDGSHPRRLAADSGQWSFVGRMSWSSDGRWLAVERFDDATGSSRIVLIERTTGPVGLVGSGTGVDGADRPPDGSWVIVEVSGGWL
jgi:Tol biopolymer transport system component